MTPLDRALKINSYYETFRVESENAIKEYRMGYTTINEFMAKLNFADIKLSEKLKGI